MACLRHYHTTVCRHVPPPGVLCTVAVLQVSAACCRGPVRLWPTLSSAPARRAGQLAPHSVAALPGHMLQLLPGAALPHASLLELQPLASAFPGPLANSTSRDKVGHRGWDCGGYHNHDGRMAAGEQALLGHSVPGAPCNAGSDLFHCPFPKGSR